MSENGALLLVCTNKCRSDANNAGRVRINVGLMPIMPAECKRTHTYCLTPQFLPDLWTLIILTDMWS